MQSCCFEASPRCPGVTPTPQDPSRLVAMLWIRSLGSTILGRRRVRLPLVARAWSIGSASCVLSPSCGCVACNEHGTIYVISSDFGDRMTMKSMGLMVLLSEHF